ncbi:MAG: hypothetical protein MJ211_09980 [Bacteroidales bacterium]|nr:hypothetical protein [Bacteroidales bacterium]
MDEGRLTSFFAMIRAGYSQDFARQNAHIFEARYERISDTDKAAIKRVVEQNKEQITSVKDTTYSQIKQSFYDEIDSDELPKNFMLGYTKEQSIETFKRIQLDAMKPDPITNKPHNILAAIKCEENIAKMKGFLAVENNDNKSQPVQIMINNEVVKINKNGGI